jgi:hypothetical protein
MADAKCAAFKKTVLVSSPYLSLNDTANFVGSHQVTIRNTGKQSVRFRVRHQAADTVLGMGKSWWNKNKELTYNKAAASVRFSKKKMAIAPGKTMTLNVNISPPRGIATSKYPLYSGWIHLEGSGDDCERHVIQYFGLAASLKDLRTLFVDKKIPFPLIANITEGEETNIVNINSPDVVFNTRLLSTLTFLVCRL